MKSAAVDATTKVSAVNLRVSNVVTSVQIAQATTDEALAGVDTAMKYTDSTAVKTLKQANAYTDARFDQL
ncbi:MAG: hypothetical protein Q8R69_23665 [Telluria sp.]|nr:hypothetical protein [Telluria sp.]